MGNVLTPLVKSVLMPLGLIAAVSATDVAIHKKIIVSGVTALIISNEKLNNIIKIVKPLEESGSLKQKNKKEDFLKCYQTPLDASLLGNLLTGKGRIRAGQDF